MGTANWQRDGVTPRNRNRAAQANRQSGADRGSVRPCSSANHGYGIPAAEQASDQELAVDFTAEQNKKSRFRFQKKQDRPRLSRTNPLRLRQTNGEN
jgi:hypothetical protein